VILAVATQNRCFAAFYFDNNALLRWLYTYLISGKGIEALFSQEIAQMCALGRRDVDAWHHEYHVIEFSHDY